jgi:PPOX class probable FMN-dependent enzyme
VTDVAERTWQKTITSKEALRALVGEPSERAANKVMDRLDGHCRAIIGRSPFMLLGTADAVGRGDVSPKGDLPGFVQVLDERTLAIPDRPGNRRTDSLKNVLENPRVGMLFLVPGKEETLRVNGRATIVLDEELLDRLAVDGKRPVLAIVVEVEECYAHCAKAFKRSGLWEPARWPESSDLPSMPQMMLDHAKLNTTLEEVEAAIAEGNKRLW